MDAKKELADILAEKTIPDKLIDRAIDALWAANMALADRCIATKGRPPETLRKQITENKEIINELKEL